MSLTSKRVIALKNASRLERFILFFLPKVIGIIKTEDWVSMTIHKETPTTQYIIAEKYAMDEGDLFNKNIPNLEKIINKSIH